MACHEIDQHPLVGSNCTENKVSTIPKYPQYLLRKQALWKTFWGQNEVSTLQPKQELTDHQAYEKHFCILYCKLSRPLVGKALPCMDYQIKLKNYLSKTMWDKSRKWAKSLQMIKEAYQRDCMVYMQDSVTIISFAFSICRF